MSPDHSYADTDTSSLYAEEQTDGWSVVDPTGGRWWPSDETAEEIEGSSDPEATALRIAIEEPMRGRWVD